MSDDSRYDAGLKVITSMFGRDLVGEHGDASGDTFSADVARLAVEQVYGDIWTRPGLAARDRSLVTIGALIALRQQAELTNHIVGGLGNGLTVEEVQEAVLHAVPYVGFPAISSALDAMGAAFAETGTDPATPN